MSHIFYFSVLIFFLMLSWIRDNITIRTNRFILTCTILTLIVLFYSIRFDVGPDYYNYYLYFVDVANYDGGEIALPRPDYLALYFISRSFSFSEYGYLVIFSLYAFVSFVLMFLAVGMDKKLYPAIFFLFCFGYIFIGFDRIRQFLAMSIFLYAYKDIIKCNFQSYLIKIIVACLFHVSAIVLLPAYLLARVKFSPVFMISTFVILVVAFYLNAWNRIIPLIYDAIPYYNTIYAETKYAGVVEFNTGLGLIGRSLIVLLVLLYGGFCDKYKSIIFIGMVLLFVGAGNLNISRISDYYLSPLILVFSAFIGNKKALRGIRSSVVIALLMLFYRDIYSPYYDYRTVLSDEFKIQNFAPRNY